MIKTPEDIKQKRREYSNAYYARNKEKVKEPFKNC